MANITYLIGAGASANALPVVGDMKNRMKAFLNFLEYYEDANQIFDGLTTKKDEIIKSFDEILSESFKHATPDTYAKKLFLKDSIESNKNLEKLKFFLSLYFLFEQSSLTELIYPSSLFSGSNDYDFTFLKNLPDPIQIPIKRNPEYVNIPTVINESKKSDTARLSYGDICGRHNNSSLIVRGLSISFWAIAGVLC